MHGIPMSPFRDAKTGKIIWGVHAGKDVGRGMAADIDPRYEGAEVWANGGLYTAKGVKIGNTLPSSTNFGIWWDGDLQRELLDSNRIDKWDYQNSRVDAQFAAVLRSPDHFFAPVSENVRLQGRRRFCSVICRSSGRCQQVDGSRILIIPFITCIQGTWTRQGLDWKSSKSMKTAILLMACPSAMRKRFRIAEGQAIRRIAVFMDLEDFQSRP